MISSKLCLVEVPDHFRPFAADGTLLKTLVNWSFLVVQWRSSYSLLSNFFVCLNLLGAKLL
jgi:hypothetical protein